MGHQIGEIPDGRGAGREPRDEVAAADTPDPFGAVRAATAQVVGCGVHPRLGDRGDVGLDPEWRWDRRFRPYRSLGCGTARRQKGLARRSPGRWHKHTLRRSRPRSSDGVVCAGLRRMMRAWRFGWYGPIHRVALRLVHPPARLQRPIVPRGTQAPQLPVRDAKQFGNLVRLQAGDDEVLYGLGLGALELRLGRAPTRLSSRQPGPRPPRTNAPRQYGS